MDLIFFCKLKKAQKKEFNFCKLETDQHHKILRFGNVMFC